MKVTFTAVFNRKGRLNTKGKAPIEIRAYQDRKRTFVSTAIMVSPEQWDEKKQQVKKHPDADIYNFQIKTLISELEKTQIEHQIKNKSFSVGNVAEAKKGFKTKSFIEFMRTEIENDQLLANKTKLSHKNTINKLIEFTGDRDIFFSELSYSFLDNFLNHLRKNGLVENTVHKQHKNLKKYIELAIKKGFHDGDNPCKEIKIRYEQKKREVLSIDELKAIEKLDLSNYDEKIGIVRDMFLFACYCGIRISDATNLKPEFVKQDKDGYSLDFVTIKVSKRALLPLHSLFKQDGLNKSKPEALLERYLDSDNEFIFPKMPEPFINRHLKILAAEAKININLTFHVARHTFGTYMATKIPLHYLMFLMQHSDIKTTMTYVNTSQELVKQGLLKVDWE